MGAPRSNRGSSVDALICVVDNDQPVRFAVENLLESAGYTTISFDSGEACLASPRRAGFAFAIIDIELGGMNGFALLEQLTAGATLLPPVLVSAYADHAMARRAIGAGAIAFLRKPIEVDLLPEHLEKALSAGARRT